MKCTCRHVDDIKIGDFADYVPGAADPLMVWDRDSNGQLAACHNAVGTGLVQSSAFQAFMTPAGCGGILGSTTPTFATLPTFTTFPNVYTVGRGAILGEPKSDGFSDGVNTFQGVRAYDSQAGIWSTPDAYRGQVHDPASQKPYMWDGNNPYAYSDPSGYDPESEIRAELAAAQAEGASYSVPGDGAGATSAVRRR